MIDRSAFPPELNLTEQEAKLASLLVLRERVSRASAHGVLYDAQRGTPAMRNVKTYICHLRKKFGRLNLKIYTLWGWGWKMTQGDREKLHAMIRTTSTSSAASPKQPATI